ncbi:MAG: family 78 glycoside hydrolase catalytic domain [Clostridia bacterium]|nr:family 78 glycoside hydrolase catalytic domain [Clostridia bacterium]
MKQVEVFGEAKWIAATPKNIEAAPLIRRSFDASRGDEATLRIIGLGTFEAFMNGKRISEDYFLPLNSEYEKTEFPVGEELTGFRIYVTEYDVTEYLCEGANTLAVLVGAGWYNGCYYGIHKCYGEKKLIFKIDIKGADGAVRSVVSDGSEIWRESFVKKSDINKGESHDYRGWCDGWLCDAADGDGWENVRLSKPVESDYCFTECPPDRVRERILPRLVYECDEYRIYDALSNLSGYPTLVSDEGYSGEIKVTFSEDLAQGGEDVDEAHVFYQELYATVDGTPCEIFPRFTWYGFRYFKVEGGAWVKDVALVCSAVEVTSGFDSDNEVLNWTYGAYIHTQLTNMHRGIPSDCPHKERLGYTGDGQLVARASIMSLGAKEFYKKWIKDISDCQDKLTGRVQYTAPFYYCGGGPGGWGCAIITVPYEYYRFYGDDTYIRELYPQMLRFFDFLDEHSEAGVVTSYKEGGWCLGDWCTPVKWTLPTPFVNTYFYVFSIQRVIEIARVIGRDEDIPALEEKMARLKKAINTFYFNSFERDDTYVCNAQGAGAFATDIGLGTEITRQKLIKYYDELGYYDTGIFGTEIVTRVLFELGEADVAFKLLTAGEPHGYGRWMRIGSTTLREYWGKECRSFSHPMFGAVVAHFYEYILGIRQEMGSAGYEKILIAPANIKALGRASGHITTPKGRIAVSYVTEGDKRIYTVEIPEGSVATVRLPDGIERTACGGVHTFEI